MESSLTWEELRPRQENCYFAKIKAPKGKPNADDNFYRKITKSIIRFLSKQEATVVLKEGKEYLDVYSSHKGEIFLEDDLENIQPLPKGCKIFFKPDRTAYFLCPDVINEYLRGWKRVLD